MSETEHGTLGLNLKILLTSKNYKMKVCKMSKSSSVRAELRTWLGRMRQEDCLSPGVQGHCQQHRAHVKSPNWAGQNVLWSMLQSNLLELGSRKWWVTWCMYLKKILNWKICLECIHCDWLVWCSLVGKSVIPLKVALAFLSFAFSYISSNIRSMIRHKAFPEDLPFLSWERGSVESLITLIV